MIDVTPEESEKKHLQMLFYYYENQDSHFEKCQIV